ncbi:MAG: hypothetical protein AAF368_08220 [Planctomycetota bacterium]
MTSTVWAQAAAGVAAQTLFEAIAREALGRFREFDSQNMANMVWAFAMAGVASQALFEAIAAEALDRLREFRRVRHDKHGLGLRLRSLGISPTFLEFGSAIAERGGDLVGKQKSQLYVVALHTQTKWPDLEFPLSSDLESLRAAYVEHELAPSQLQQQVSVVLANRLEPHLRA